MVSCPHTGLAAARMAAPRSSWGPAATPRITGHPGLWNAVVNSAGQGPEPLRPVVNPDTRNLGHLHTIWFIILWSKYVLPSPLRRQAGEDERDTFTHGAVVCFACCIQSILAGLRARNLSSILKGNTPPGREHCHTGMWIYTLRTPFNQSFPC